MGDDGRRDLPRPPRRVPGAVAAANPRTSIQPASPRNRPDPPPPRPRRLRAGLLVPLLVVLLVAAAGAGWLIREQRRRLDSERVLRQVGPSVVRVLATTCAGTGQATGVRIGEDLVLTTASAIRGPVSVGVETRNGQVRRAGVRGVNEADGIAVLQVIGPLDGGPAELAPIEPGAGEDRAILGYGADEQQAVQPVGPSKSARSLTEVIGDASLGAPVLDIHGRVVGLVTGDTVGSGKVVQLDELRKYAVGRPPVVAERPGQCEQARGPQAPQTPLLTSANTPLAGEVQEIFKTYLNNLNRHDIRAMRETYAPVLAGRIPLDKDIEQHRTSYAFGAKIGPVQSDGKYTRAVMSYTVLHWVDGPIPPPQGLGVTCSRWNISYLLIRIEGRLRIVGTNPVGGAPEPWRSCDA